MLSPRSLFGLARITVPLSVRVSAGGGSSSAVRIAFTRALQAPGLHQGALPARAAEGSATACRTACLRRDSPRRTLPVPSLSHTGREFDSSCRSICVPLHTHARWLREIYQASQARLALLMFSAPRIIAVRILS